MEAKDEIINTFLEYPEDTVFVVDPEGEYAPLAKLLNGTVIKISPDSASHLNPLDFHSNFADDGDPIWYKTDFLINIFESSILNDRYGSGLSAGAKSLIDKCTRSLYLKTIEELKEREEEMTPEKTPTLSDFHKILMNEPGRDARELAQALELYTTGSLNYFNHKTNVEINNRFVVFDISEMGKSLKTLGLLIVLDYIWKKILERGSMGKNTWFYVDEAHLLFRNDNSAEFMRDLYKRARKFGGINTSITQNIEDLMTNEIARTMISNSNFVVMLRQSTSDKMMLAELLNIPDSLLTFITESPKGQGLIYTGEKSIAPFVNTIPKGILYDAMTTKVGEKATEIVEAPTNELEAYV
jgi:type IV secretory pathway VirB4 component